VAYEAPLGVREALVSRAMSLLSDAEVEQRLAGVPEWRRAGGACERGAGGSASSSGEDAIERELVFADFEQAVAFVNRVAEAAEAANHHPDILVHAWNMVRLTLFTHSEGGLTNADFRLAGQIDGLG
jgi:4a-hydroxytetrahydrobiopterin dehydratase